VPAADYRAATLAWIAWPSLAPRDAARLETELETAPPRGSHAAAAMTANAANRSIQCARLLMSAESIETVLALE
jgi:hypothetical protein